MFNLKNVESQEKMQKAWANEAFGNSVLNPVKLLEMKIARKQK